MTRRARREARAKSNDVVTTVVTTAVACACVVAGRARGALGATVTAVRAAGPVDGSSLAPGDDVVVRATIETSGWGRGVEAKLRCRAGWNAETEEAMRDDGVWPDEYANDGVYAGRCRTGGVAPGERVRWRVTTTAPSYYETPWPGEDGKGPKYFGTVLEKGLWVDTTLPVLHVFTPDYWRITTDEGARVSVYFEGEFYDNVFMRRRGSNRKEAVIGVDLSAAQWPKHKFKLDFKGSVFRFDAGERRVEEINLHSAYQEPGEETYLRETLAFHILRRAGVPASLTKYVHVRVNNDFYGLFYFVEQVDGKFLKRNGMDPKGPLYKAVHWKYSNLRHGNPSIPCPYATPDYPMRWMNDGCPEIYRKASKRDRDNWDDLWELTQTIERARADVNGAAHLLYDTLNLPALINEMAAQTLILGADRCTKNYYMHKDWTGEWSRLPWDVEDAFPGDKRYGTGLCSPSECSPSSTAYCILSCEKFNSPLYCDRNHPQDIFYADPKYPEQDPSSTYNVLIDVLLTHWPTKEMYLTRLRTLMDDILATSFVDKYVRNTLQTIRKDALRDSEKWSVGAVRAIDQGVTQLLSQIVPKRRDQLFNEYAYMIPPSIPSNARVFASHARRYGDEAYVKLSNPNGYAVDVSFWTISTPGGWRYRLKPGTVLGPGRALFVVKDAKKFRERATWARREYPEGVFVQGNFDRDLDTDDVREISVSSAKRVATLSAKRAQRRFRPLVGFNETSCVVPDHVGNWSAFGDCCAAGAGECGLFCGVDEAARVRRRDINVTIGRDPEEPLPCLVQNFEVDRTCARAKCGAPTVPNATACAPFAPSSPPSGTRSVVVDPILGLNQEWEDWGWGINQTTITLSDRSTATRVDFSPGGGISFSTARAFPNVSRVIEARAWVARHRSPQPLPRLVMDYERDRKKSPVTVAAEFASESAESAWRRGCFAEARARFDEPAPRSPERLKITIRNEYGSPLRVWLSRVEIVFA